jgi:hypothetical protein
LSKNPVGPATDDDDFSGDIQEIENIQADTPREEDKIFSI